VNLITKSQPEGSSRASPNEPNGGGNITVQIKPEDLLKWDEINAVQMKKIEDKPKRRMGNRRQRRIEDF
jgi:hypothetical protein